MNEIIEKLQQKTDVSAYSKNFIRNLIHHRMSELNMNEVAEYKNYIDRSISEMDKLEGQLKNSYSMFFRNRLTFETLGQVVLPRIAMQKTTGNEVRVWSAGCAGGHEAYSLAILFESFNEISSKKIKYRIFATDRDYAEIQKAALGEYGRHDLGNLTVLEKEKWFQTNGKIFKIIPEIKKCVQFELFDFLQTDAICPPSSIFGGFDIIMCANVLIYYNEDAQQRVISNLRKCISENGFIVTGEAERDVFVNKGFTEISQQCCIFRF